MIDLYDGMDMPDIGMGTERAQQGTKNAEQEKGEGDDRERESEVIQMEATCGNVDLNKRKPPDGSQDTRNLPFHLARCNTT